MIDIPIGKALIAVENDICKGCCFYLNKLENGLEKDLSDCEHLECGAEDREDGKDVIFKFVDYQPKGGK